jgi:hypothetical protein
MLTARVGIALALAWLVPLGAHAVGLDVLLPLVVLAALVAVQRGAGPLLDRVVVSLAQLFGALCAAGLIVSWWPWGFNRVLICGFALSGLAVLGTLRGVTRPARGDWRDALVALGWLAVTLLAAVPFVTRSAAGRLGLVSPGEDLVRHFGLYDAIGHVDGYAFMHLDAAKPVMPDVGILTYPQATHFLYALLGRFAGVGPSGAAAMDWFIWCELGTFSFVVLAVLWGVKRIAGPSVTPPALLLVLLPVTAYLVCGDLLGVLMRGFPNELLSLGLVALLVAVLTRPLERFGAQVLTIAALVVGVSFTYYLFLPIAGLMVLIWAVGHRAELRGHLAKTALAVVCAPLALVTPLSNPGANNGNVLLTKGTALTVDRPVLVIMVLVAALGCYLARDRMAGLCLGVVVAAVAVLAVYQYVAIGQTVYYFEKILHLTIAVALVCLGALGRRLPAWPAGAPARARLGPAVASLAVCALLAGLGGPNHTRPISYGLHIVLDVEKGSPDAGQDALTIARRYPEPTGPVVVDLRHSRYADYFATLCGAAMRRDVPDSGPWADLLWPPGGPRGAADLTQVAGSTSGQVRFLVADPSGHVLAGPNGPSDLDLVRALAAEFPDRVLIG